MTAQEARLELSKAISEREREIYRGDVGTASQDAADAKDLMRALARLVAGQAFTAAFGSPGDWGYSTLIGRALHNAYRSGFGNECIR